MDGLPVGGLKSGWLSSLVPLKLTGGVKKGYLHAGIVKLSPLEMGLVNEMFKSSKTLVEITTVKGHPNEKITVDLTDAAITQSLWIGNYCEATCFRALVERHLLRYPNS